MEAARQAYDALTEDQKALVPADVLKKLTTAEGQVKQATEEAEKQEAADKSAAKSVTDAIAALSGSAGTGDKAAVEAARQAYDALTEDQKALITADVLKKLTTAESQVQAAEEEAAKVDIGSCKISAIKDRTYTGKKLTPALTIKNGKTKLKKGTDYTASYKKNKAVGTATVTVKGIGAYKGKAKVTFKINPKKPAFSKLTGGKKQITLQWKKVAGVSGYEIQYSLKKNFSDATTVKVRKAKTVKKVIKKLQAGKKYYVRIRTYKTVKKVTYRSGWSKKKTVKTKGKAASAEPNQVPAGAAETDDAPMLIIENAAEVPEADDPGAEAMVVLSDE